MHVARQEEEEEEEDLEEEEPDAVWKGERAKGCSSACLLTGRLLGPRRVLPRAFLRDGGREDEQETGEEEPLDGEGYCTHTQRSRFAWMTDLGVLRQPFLGPEPWSSSRSSRVGFGNGMRTPSFKMIGL